MPTDGFNRERQTNQTNRRTYKTKTKSAAKETNENK